MIRAHASTGESVSCNHPPTYLRGGVAAPRPEITMPPLPPLTGADRKRLADPLENARIALAIYRREMATKRAWAWYGTSHRRYLATEATEATE